MTINHQVVIYHETLCSSLVINQTLHKYHKSCGTSGKSCLWAQNKLSLVKNHEMHNSSKRKQIFARINNFELGSIRYHVIDRKQQIYYCRLFRLGFWEIFPASKIIKKCSRISEETKLRLENFTWWGGKEFQDGFGKKE